MIKCLQIIVILLLLYCTIGTSSARPNACSLKLDGHNPGYFRDGDIILGGVLQFYQYNQLQDIRVPPNDVVCNRPETHFLRHFLAFDFAIEEINKNQKILPNITLGYEIYDSCSSTSTAVNVALRILSGGPKYHLNYDCHKKGTVMAFIGHLLSPPTISIANLLKVYDYPQVSYGAMDTVFDDRIQFPSLFRTVASTRVLNTAIVQLLKHFGWTWVGIITSDEKLSTSEELRQEIVRSGSCIEFVFVSPQKITEHTFENLDRHSAGVIILVFTLEHLLHFVSFLGKSNIMSRKVFILSSDFLPQKQSNGKEDTLWALNGSLFFTLGNGHIPGLKEFLYKASPAIYPNNRLLNELWLVLFKCYHAGYTESKRICKKNFSMESLSPFDYDVNNFRLTYSLYTAVYSLAHALHNMYSAAMKKQKLETFNLNTFYPWKVSNY
ncbi:extracellular calcium-sensing receptor-like isoform X2 [Ascaphus truei]|uniref:extracellular calcium-sensing receptor-like isoform X1 n=1 Tax=Ascaphus truei TaxID=8439 RepID=UPI003F5AB47B